MRLIEIVNGQVVIEVSEYECQRMVDAFTLAELAAQGAFVPPKEFTQRDALALLFSSLAMFWESAHLAAEYAKLSLSEFRREGRSYEAASFRRMADNIQPDHAMQRLHERLTDLFGEVIAHEIFSDVLGYDPIEDDQAETSEGDEGDAASAGGDE